MLDQTRTDGQSTIVGERGDFYNEKYAEPKVFVRKGSAP
jgi:hypothetical protein